MTNVRALIERLNPAARTALNEAANLCQSRTHYEIEIEHLLNVLLDASDPDLTKIFHEFGVDSSRLTRDLMRALERLKRGNARDPLISPHILRLLSESWTIASLDFNAKQIRSGHFLLALVAIEDLARIAREISPEFNLIKADSLKSEFANILGPDAGEAADEDGTAPAAKLPGGKTPNLDQYTVDLTERARQGQIDPVLGRDFEIRQVVDILMRRRQNNPILTGEAGVGKTAVVEGFALRLAKGDVPASLKNVTLRALDLALLQAGAGVKGEFENRLKGLIEEVKSSPTPIILFIDEAHTMIGAGGQAGQNDAANLLKPALARGELRTIAATTWSEYKKYFEKDAALARRFQVVKVEEPAEKQCAVMLRGVVGALEKHHDVRILDEAVTAAVHLSHRYLIGRQLPDKAVSVLDTACARLSLGQRSTPAAIEDISRRLDDLAVQHHILTRESAAGADHRERLEEIEKEKAVSETEHERLQETWRRAQELVTRMRELRGKLEELPRDAPDGEAAPLRQELDTLSKELETLQGEKPLIRACVDQHVVSEVISAWTGIPVGKMVQDEIALVLALESHLEKRVLGQSYALKMISQRISTARAKLDDPGKPIGVFLLVGPSGVGKTETALALSELLYGGERNVITINMSEFQEAHTVSTLKGSPPGYVGYGEGGVLTEAVRRRPYSVVLLDEVEKAHPDVLELFYQVFDKGHMEDGEGREIDFKNTIILLTSNACTDQLMKLCADPETEPGPEALVQAIKPELNKIFKPAFLGRMAIVPYYPVRDEILKRIVVLKLNKIRRRLEENHRLQFTYTDELVEAVRSRCTEVESGARNVDHILTNSLLAEMSKEILARLAEGRKLNSVRVTTGSDGNFAYSFEDSLAAIGQV